jgi:hypothetical protein
MNREHVFPIPPRCGSGAYGCHNEADTMLIDPDGGVNPGGWVCCYCGRRIIAEYAEKLGETWTLEPIVRTPTLKGEPLC